MAVVVSSAASWLSVAVLEVFGLRVNKACFLSKQTEVACRLAVVCLQALCSAERRKNILRLSNGL